MSYEILDCEKKIICLQCGLHSLDPGDIKEKRCPLCGISHGDYDRLGLESNKPKFPFMVGEKIILGDKKYFVLRNLGYYGRVRDEKGEELFPFFWFNKGEWCRRRLNE